MPRLRPHAERAEDSADLAQLFGGPHSDGAVAFGRHALYPSQPRGVATGGGYLVVYLGAGFDQGLVRIWDRPMEDRARSSVVSIIKPSFVRMGCGDCYRASSGS